MTSLNLPKAKQLLVQLQPYHLVVLMQWEPHELLPAQECKDQELPPVDWLTPLYTASYYGGPSVGIWRDWAETAHTPLALISVTNAKH